MGRIIAVLAILCVMGVAPRAEWKAEYEALPPEVRAWYRNAELTPEAKLRLPYKNCCDHADVVQTQFRVNRFDNRDEWFWLNGKQWQRIPDDVIHWGENAPGGQPTIFVYQGTPTCFYPGEGGG